MKDWSSYLTQYDAAKARAYRELGYWGDLRLADYLRRHADRLPEKVAIVDPHARTTFRQLDELVDALSRALVAHGVEEGDVVSFQVPNRMEFTALVLACNRAGAVFNPIGTIFRQREVEVMLKLARPALIVTVDAFAGFRHGDMMLEIASRLAHQPEIVVLAGAAPAGATSWDAFVAEGRALLAGDRFASPHVDPDAVTLLAFTSGTTGQPKGVLHTNNSLLYTSGAFVERRRVGESDVFHTAVTMAHLAGFAYALQVAIMCGATAVYQDRWDAEEFLRVVEEERVTMSEGPVPVMRDFLRAPSFARRDLASLRQFACIGSGLPAPLAREAIEKLPTCSIFGGWGMTENGLAVVNQLGDSMETVCNTEGLPCAGVELQIRDDDFQAILKTGEQGELVIRGATSHLGFIQPEFSEALFLPGGWYVTGDRGLLKPDGYLVITGRSKDMIIRGGENVPVAEIENALLEHPAVFSVALVAVPDERLGERACACVLLEQGHTLTLADVAAWMAEKQVTKHFWPELVECFEAFPTTASGKIQKFELRRQVQERLGVRSDAQAYGAERASAAGAGSLSK